MIGTLFYLTSGFGYSASFTFIYEGDLEGSESVRFFRPYNISDDGKTVVGQLNVRACIGRPWCTNQRRKYAARWTNGDVGKIGPNSSRSTAVSSDGSISVGWVGNLSDSTDGGPRGKPFRISDDTFAELTIPRDLNAVVTDVSDDGTTLGYLVDGGPRIFDHEAVFWDEIGSLVRLGVVPDKRNSQAFKITPDGANVVGKVFNDASDEVAFIWNQQSGIVLLPELRPFQSHSASAVSNDGSIVYGIDRDQTSAKSLLRWSLDDNSRWSVNDLGVLSVNDVDVTDTSADGSVVVGTRRQPNELHSEAFIWEERHGIRSLKDVLQEDFSFEISDLLLQNVVGISDDGLRLAGIALEKMQGQRTERVWFANLELLLGDFNNNDDLDVDDNGYNENAEPVQIEATGWHARILQHEIDHLQGRLCIDLAYTQTLATFSSHEELWKDRDVNEIKQELGVGNK